MVNCSDNSSACFQTSVKYDNGSYKGEDFDSGCLDESDCDRYKKGDIGYCNDLKAMRFTVECVSECCQSAVIDATRKICLSRAKALPL